MRQQPERETPAQACGVPEPGGTTGRSGWLMAIPVMGVLFCCGGPLIGAWLASTGLLAVVGSWWVGAGRWVVLGLSAVVIGGLTAWVARRRIARG